MKTLRHFVGAMLMQLVEDGKLKLDDKISKGVTKP
jgi:CubicO group peptidase (beta-lactamase class C family)